MWQAYKNFAPATIKITKQQFMATHLHPSNLPASIKCTTKWLTAIIIYCCLTIVSCTNSDNNNDKILIKNAAQEVEDNPQKAIDKLQMVCTEDLSEDDYAYYVLLQVRAWSILGINIATADDAVKKAVNHFTQNNNAEKAAYAHFILGKVYNAQHKFAKALYQYRVADEWAAKADYYIANFRYSAIPYNISLILKVDEYYEESLQYIEKALKHIANENGSYTDMLYALEMKGICYKCLENVDSAAFYYNKALAIAEQHNDNDSKSRIIYNKCIMLSDFNYDNTAKEECKKSILFFEKQSDEPKVQRLYVALALVYYNDNKIDSATLYINKAKKLFSPQTHNGTKQSLYYTLYLVEEKKGNLEKARQHYKEYSDFIISMRNARKAEEAEIQNELRKEQSLRVTQVLTMSYNSRILFQNERRNNNKNMGLSATGFLLAGAGLLWQQGRKSRRKMRKFNSMRMQCKHELMNNVWQRRDIIAVLDWLDRYIDKKQSPTVNDLEQLGDMVDGMLPHSHWLQLPPLFRVNFGTMFIQLEKDFPMLNEMEYRLCCLMCTKLFDTDELAEVLKVEVDELEKIKITMQYKIGNAGYTLNALLRYAERLYYKDKE